MKYILFLIVMSVTLLGCEQQADNSMKDKINFVPNEEYVGDPSPEVNKEVKLTDEEKADFEKLQKEIQAEKEAE
ncbi:hypothetical protein DRW41_01145 [Neobacillus piezotolerans]|uniref:Lipoprotein n=1 Tax=Neobacillus piezotolerans TaxID=2259171 RepID=A0A3D8GUU2_9BACI|nr:hypothetical protein [Neobacillus piezotolerans]RDU38205.1 hypothetical protein DRW41_01145 [Neobacillus piezotolerans]